MARRHARAKPIARRGQRCEAGTKRKLTAALTCNAAAWGRASAGVRSMLHDISYRSCVPCSNLARRNDDACLALFHSASFRWPMSTRGTARRRNNGPRDDVICRGMAKMGFALWREPMWRVRARRHWRRWLIIFAIAGAIYRRNREIDQSRRSRVWNFLRREEADEPCPASRRKSS